MLSIIGLGLNLENINLDLEKYKEIYLENYTVNFPYSLEELESKIDRKIKLADREFVESERIVELAKKKDIALLVYGSPLFATTHISLLKKARETKTKIEIEYNASVLDAVGEILSLYKFGKITSLPAWKKNFTPDSFMEVVKANLSIKAHSLILVDPFLDLDSCLDILEKSSKNHNIKLEKVIIASRLGNKDRKIIYDRIEKLKKEKVKEPYCLIIPSSLNFVEEENLNLSR